MNDLTARQQKILDYIREYIDEKGYPPSFRDIGTDNGIRSPNGVNCHLKALEKKGFIKRSPKLSRGLAITESHPDTETDYDVLFDECKRLREENAMLRNQLNHELGS